MITELFGFELQNEAPSSVQAKVGIEPLERNELFGFELQNEAPSSVQAKVGEPVGDPTDRNELFGFELQNEAPSSVQAKVGLEPTATISSKSASSPNTAA